MFVRLFFVVALAVALSAEAASPKLNYEPTRTIIETSGEPGNFLKVEAADQLKNPSWDVLSAFVLTNRAATVIDTWCGGKPRRFYRVTQSPSSQMPFAYNFRLLDQVGKAHELHYYLLAEDIQAFVLIFAANGCDELQARLPQIQALRSKFAGQGVVFWMIDSNPSDTRATIASEASRLGIDFPVLHDVAQSVAKVYNVSTAAEIVCASRETFEVFYRGALDDRASETAQPTRNYVDEALSAFLKGESPQIMQMKATGCDLTNSPVGDIAYSTVIAPLLQAKCVKCHSPGNIAPWAMTNHAIVQSYSSWMMEKVMTKEMPPWHADPEFGKFQNNFALTPTEEKQLVDWVLAGAPRGTGPDPLENIPPPPPRWPTELGEPDLILRPPLQQVAATGIEPYRYIFVDTGLTEDRWLKAAIVKPTNRRVVHHYLVWEGKSMDQMASGLAGYVPGMQDLAFPTDTGVLLPAGSTLTFNLHYTPSGTAGTDQPELALWFHTAPPAKQMITLPLVNQDFTIPAGAREYPVAADTTPYFTVLPIPVTLYGMAPHMHLRGRSMRFEAEYPDGKRETLLSVPDYSFNWQTRYRLNQPRVIPAGTKVWVTGTFDNSKLNFANPDPTSAVKWGEQSFEEMFIGYFDVSL